MKDEPAKMKKDPVEEKYKDDTSDLSMLAISKMVEAKFKPDNFIDEMPWEY